MGPRQEEERDSLRSPSVLRLYVLGMEGELQGARYAGVRGVSEPAAPREGYRGGPSAVKRQDRAKMG